LVGIVGRWQFGNAGEVMKSKAVRGFFMGVAVLLVLGISGCGHDQELTSITVTPSNTTITGQGLELQFTALGHYIHPPETKDITSTVIWKSQADQIISFITPDKPGLATSGFGCGDNLGISAVVYKNPTNPSSGSAVIGTATVNVKQINNPNCP
jgi:hypothetical protein